MKKRTRYSENFQTTIRSPVKLENPLNQDIWYCEDFNDTYSVDGIEYVRVYKKDTPNRTNLMRKTALQKVA